MYWVIVALKFLKDAIFIIVRFTLHFETEEFLTHVLVLFSFDLTHRRCQKKKSNSAEVSKGSQVAWSNEKIL